MKRPKYPILKKRYQELREHHGGVEFDWTQARLAKELNITKTQISQLENGRREPSVTELKAYSKFFNVPMEYLLGIADNRYYENMLLGKHLGLSDEAIKGITRILALTISQGFKPNNSPMSVLNSLLGFKGNRLKFLLYYILEYFEFKKPDNIQSFDVFLPVENQKQRTASSIPSSPLDSIECDSEEAEELHLFKIQKNFIDLIKEIKEVQNPSEDKKNG